MIWNPVTVELGIRLPRGRRSVTHARRQSAVPHGRRFPIDDAPVTERVVVCSVYSDRPSPSCAGEQVFRRTIESHLGLAGDIAYVWVANALPKEPLRELRRHAEATRRPLTLIVVDRQLPIAQSYNLALHYAKDDARAAAFLELQDDVIVPNDALAWLLSSPYDFPALAHDSWPLGEAHVRHHWRFVCGVCMCIRRSVFDTIGYHDERFIKAVDFDYGHRAVAAGLTCGYVPGRFVKHVGHVTTMGDSRALQKLFIGSFKFARQLEMEGTFQGYRSSRWAEIGFPESNGKHLVPVNVRVEVIRA